MATHNVTIYHCLACGRLVHAELGATPPVCCGKAMTNSCSETINDADIPAEKKAKSPGSASTAESQERDRPS